MEDAMVTGRMDAQKKREGNTILRNAGLNVSQAINLMYAKLIKEKSPSFLDDALSNDPLQWKAAAAFIDSLSTPESRNTEFDAMTDAQIKTERLRSRGLIS